MGHTLEISDEAYQTLLTLARQEGQTPKAVIESWVRQQARTHARTNGGPTNGRHYYTTDEWFRHLGMTDDDIRRAKEEAEADDDADA